MFEKQKNKLGYSRAAAKKTPGKYLFQQGGGVDGADNNAY